MKLINNEFRINFLKLVYAPIPNALAAEMRRYPNMHDEDYANYKFGCSTKKDNDLLILPIVTNQNRRIIYRIHEYQPLLDSSNMTVDDWIRIAKDIEVHLDFISK